MSLRPLSLEDLLPPDHRARLVWAFAERLAVDAGCLVSPGEFYGPAGADHVRIAVVQPDERLELVAARLGVT